MRGRMNVLAVLTLLCVAAPALAYWSPLVAGEEGKCGCCPKPCCCHCVHNETVQTSTTPVTTTTPDIICYSELDLALIIDESDSVGSYDDWVALKQFVADTVDSLDIGDNATLVGMVTFSNNASVRWNFNDEVTKNRADLIDAILSMDYWGGFTNTAEGLLVADTAVFNTDGDRDWPNDSDAVPNAALVITAGHAQFRLHEYEDIANKLKDTATVLVLGVGRKINMTELQMIASAPELIFNVNQFSELGDVLRFLQKTTCSSPMTPSKPTPTQLVYSEEECFCCCPPPPAQSYGPGRKYCNC